MNTNKITKENNQIQYCVLLHFLVFPILEEYRAE